MFGPKMSDFHIWLLLVWVLLWTLMLLTASHEVKPAKRPNFIIILADDMGWGDLDANQPERKSNNTPNLNLMAAQGLKMTDFHSPASTCSPSRAAILTGRYGLRNGVTHNFAVESVAGLPLSEVTFPQLLQKEGYYTAMIGKWHLGHNGPYRPTKRGFDYYLGIPYSNDMGCTDKPGYNLPKCPPCESTGSHLMRSLHGGCYSKLALPLIENISIVEQPLDLWSLTDQYKSAALQIIHNASARGQPYLLYMALAHMHVPLAPPPPAGAASEGVYTSSLKEMDSLVGTIRSASDDTDKNNTLIWFTGDNGPWEQKCQYAGSVGSFTGKWQTNKGGGSAKQTTWEGGHRVPAVAYWPGRIPENTSSSALLSGMDIFPTLLSLAGINPPADRRYDGMDATNVLLHQEHMGHEFLFHPNSGAAGQFGDLQTVRAGKYKAFYITGGAEACGGTTGRPQLHDPPLIFDLERDTAEETPLQVQTPEYLAVAQRIARRREELLWDIATDKSVSTADYRKEESAAPCCDRRQAVCRCNTLD
ncbi:arylsulfatase G isoform X1 [Oryzias latipes]|uniref:Arylsulfatase G n=2 Tax=Oryzias latipes TaxID=8090 RepID=H2LFE3_ORYLA|nr:arylsulfatase G isoform X1 [Oryzias latipes]